MMALKRVGGPVVSPDGKWVLFSAVDVSLNENKKTSHLWSFRWPAGMHANSPPMPRAKADPSGRRTGNSSCSPVHMAAARKSG